MMIDHISKIKSMVNFNKFAENINKRPSLKNTVHGNKKTRVN